MDTFQETPRVSRILFYNIKLYPVEETRKLP